MWDGGRRFLETKSQTGPKVPGAESPPPNPGSTPAAPLVHFFPSFLTSSQLHPTLETPQWLRTIE